MVRLGVFLPVTNNGWIISANSPQFLPSFALNRQICTLAERIGFDYVFSMGKWRGYGGATEFWKYSIESMTLMSGLAPVIPRLQLIASVAPALIHPAVFAKMGATLDDIAGGRLGINIVSAGNRAEYDQMGMYPKNFEDFRYEYTEEWLTVVQRLWKEDRVDHDGEYFHLQDCEWWPKPVQQDVPIVCATSSERGFRFAAEYCTDAFFGGVTVEQKVATSQRIKEVAGEYGREVRTHTLISLIQGDSDADAERIYQHFLDGADHEAIANVYNLRARAQDKTAAQDQSYRERHESQARLFYGGAPVIAGPERIAEMIEQLAVDGHLDGAMFVFPDFVEGLQRFSDQVMPLLRQRGVLAAAAGAAR